MWFLASSAESERESLCQIPAICADGKRFGKLERKHQEPGGSSEARSPGAAGSIVSADTSGRDSMCGFRGGGTCESEEVYDVRCGLGREECDANESETMSGFFLCFFRPLVPVQEHVGSVLVTSE